MKKYSDRTTESQKMWYGNKKIFFIPSNFYGRKTCFEMMIQFSDSGYMYTALKVFQYIFTLKLKCCHPEI